jgi:hypothetical protein
VANSLYLFYQHLTYGQSCRDGASNIRIGQVGRLWRSASTCATAAWNAFLAAVLSVA